MQTSQFSLDYRNELVNSAREYKNKQFLTAMGAWSLYCTGVIATFSLFAALLIPSSQRAMFEALTPTGAIAMPFATSVLTFAMSYLGVGVGAYMASKDHFRYA